MSNFMLKIGNEYFVNKSIKSYGTFYPSLYKTEKSKIKSLTGIYEDRMDEIPAYDGFILSPENNPELYKRNIMSENGQLLYNLYHLPDHKKGKHLNINGQIKWPNIMKLLKHIAPDEKPSPDSRYTYNELLMDFMAISWKNPTQNLPHLALFSEERNFATEAFFDLIRLIFQNNVRTDYYADFNIFGKQIGFANFVLLKDPHARYLVQHSTIEHFENLKGYFLNGLPNFEIKRYNKLIVEINREIRYLSEGNQDLYMVFNTLPFKVKSEPYFLDLIKQELPHYLDYLMNHHQILTNNESNVWFKQSDYITQVPGNLKLNLKNTLLMYCAEALLKLYSSFSSYNENNLIEFSLNNFLECFSDYDFSSHSIKSYLKQLGIHKRAKKVEFECSISGKKVFEIPFYVTLSELNANLLNIFPKNELLWEMSKKHKQQ